MQMNRKQMKKLLIVALAAWLKWSATAAAAPSFDAYCGDGTCNEEGCSFNGNETPGNGCRESPYNCPDDCGEPPGGGCTPSWSHSDTIVGYWSYNYWLLPPGRYYSDYMMDVIRTFHDDAHCGDPDYQMCWSGPYLTMDDENFIDACDYYMCTSSSSICP